MITFNVFKGFLSYPRSLAADVYNALRGIDGAVVDLSGKTGIAEMGAVLKQCGMLISGDTGPMHIAAAVGTPVLALFYGTAYPWETGPYGPGHFIMFPDLPCAPCSNPDACEGHRCKEMLTPDRVVRAFTSFERFRAGGPVADWSRPPDLKMLVTEIDGKGEQALNPVSGASRPPCTSGFSDRPLTLYDCLIQKSRDMNDAFLDGNLEQGFALFSEYLETMQLIRSTLPFPAQTDARLAPHLQACLTSLQAADFITIRDIVDRVLNPLLEKALFS